MIAMPSLFFLFTFFFSFSSTSLFFATLGITSTFLSSSRAVAVCLCVSCVVSVVAGFCELESGGTGTKRETCS